MAIIKSKSNIYKQKSKSEHEVFNVMSSILERLVADMVLIEDNLAGALRGRYSSFIESLTTCQVFKQKIFRFFKGRLPHKDKINLLLKLAELNGELGKLEKGAIYINKAYSYLIGILIYNDVIFPKALKSMKWGDFVKDETR